MLPCRSVRGGRGTFRAKAVFSMMVSPNSRIWGSTPMTSSMEIKVPRPRHSPMAVMAASEVKKQISVPADARMVPEVTMVGKARFRASTIASRQLMRCFSSMYRLEITMA